MRYFALLVIIVGFLFSLGLSNHGLWSADEPRVAEIGREMAETGNWAVPMLNGKPFLEEPPLYYGTLALTFKAFGVSDKVARIPSALFALAGVLALFFIANSLFGPRPAFFSGLILATGGEYFRVAHWVIVDGALTFFVISAIGLFITGYLAGETGKKLLYYILMYVSCTLAFYTKGFIGIVIPGLTVLVFLAFERNFREILKMRLWLGIIIFFVLTLPWFIALWKQAGTEYLNVFFVHNHLQRFLPASMAGKISGAASGHHNPFYYYITELPSGFLLWSIILIPALYLAFAKAGSLVDAAGSKGRLLAKCWFLTGLAFLTIASTKRTLYLMPVFGSISILTALYIESTIVKTTVPASLKRTGYVFMWIFAAFFFIVGVGLPIVCLFLRDAYLPFVPGVFAPAVFTLSVLLVFSSAASVRYLLLQDGMERFWTCITASVAFMLIFALLVFVPVLDRHKTFVPFSAAVQASVPPKAPLYGYQPDETLRGAIPFYTGRRVIETEDLHDLTPLLAKDEPFYIMIRDRRGKTERELLSTGKLFVIVKQIMGTDRALVLLSNRPVTRAVIMGDPLDTPGHAKPQSKKD